jgi:hypothetical protein
MKKTKLIFLDKTKDKQLLMGSFGGAPNLQKGIEGVQRYT